jgi:hypothetical protein
VAFFTTMTLVTAVPPIVPAVAPVCSCRRSSPFGATLKAEGMGPSAIAKTLKIGRASVYRALEN